MGVEKQKKNPFDVLMDWMAFLAGVILLLITVMVTYSVILRYLMIRPPIWVLQFTEYGLLWLTFLAGAWLLRLNGHIRIDTIVNLLPEKAQRKLDILNDFLGCLITLVIVYFGTLHTLDMANRGILDVKATNVPMALVFWIIPFGALLLMIQFARDVWRKARKEFSR